MAGGGVLKHCQTYHMIIPEFTVLIIGHSKLEFSFPSTPSRELHAGGRPISIIHYYLNP